MKRLSGITGIAAVSALVLFVACGGDDGNPTDVTGGDDVTGDVAQQDVVEDATTDNAQPDNAQPDAVEDTQPLPTDWDAYLHPGNITYPVDGKKRVLILHTNDMHSHVNGTGPVRDFSPETMNDDDTVGGFARLASMIEREKVNLGDNVDMMLLDGGDFSFGTAFTALAPETGLELRMMDDMGYVGTTVGNHELDWTPAGLAEVIEKGIADGSELTVLASNLVFSDSSAEDDALAALVGTKIKPYKVVTLSNGLKVGFFGLLGVNAIKLSPHSDPVTVKPLADAANEMVNVLRNTENVDLVVAMSHSGVAEGETPGEDETLAQAVSGIDVIISGHTHTLLSEPTVINGTLIVQAGCYGKYLGRLQLVQKDGGGFEIESWATLPVDDSSPGWPSMIESVDGYSEMLGESVFGSLGVGYSDGVATTAFDLVPVELSESSLGSFIADAVRASAAKFSGETFDVAFEANGAIRDGLLKGKSGILTLGDIVQVLPLGIGPDHQMGYPILSLYLTAGEIKSALEIIVGVAPMISDSFFLQVSGLTFEYKESADMLYKVTAVYLADGSGGYETTPLDTSEANTKLYHVATNLYIGQMLGVVKSYLGGFLTLDPKDKDGAPFVNIEDAIIDIDPATDGVQELKLWRAMYDFMAGLPVPSGETLPAIPSAYGTDLDRMKPVP